MASLPDTKAIVKGDYLCRPTEWVDVAKFFLLNYGLHALTVLPNPGSNTLQTVILSVATMLLPFIGTVRGINAVYRLARSEPNSLRTALYSGALCMVLLPGQLVNKHLLRNQSAFQHVASSTNTLLQDPCIVINYRHTRAASSVWAKKPIPPSQGTPQFHRHSVRKHRSITDQTFLQLQRGQGCRRHYSDPLWLL